MAREMKNSGIEWIGDIPSDWVLPKVKNLFTIGRGRVISQLELEDTGYPVYSSQTKNNGCLGYISTYDFDRSQLTWTTDGANAGTVFLREGKHNCTNVCGTLLPKTDEHNLHYLKYSLEFIAIYHKRADINGYKIMNNEMAEIVITLPPRQEQDKIADFLDRKCAEIDTVIEKTKATIEEYKKLKQSVITEAVTKGIRGDHPMKDSGIDWIGDIPADWDCLKAKYLFQVGDGSLKIGPFGSALSGKTLEEGPYKIYNQAHLVSNDFSLNRHFVSESTFEVLKSYEVKPGDVLFSMMGTIGKCRIMPSGYCKGIMDSHLLKARLNELVDEKYFSYVYDKDHSSIGIGQLNYYSNGSIMSGLNSTIVKNIHIPLPSLEEQKEIADFLDVKCAEIDKLIADKTHLLEEMESYKKSVIYEYVTGKKEVE